MVQRFGMISHTLPVSALVSVPISVKKVLFQIGSFFGPFLIVNNTIKVYSFLKFGKCASNLPKAKAESVCF